MKLWCFWPVNASRFAPRAQVAMLDSWRSPHFVPGRTRCCTEGMFLFYFSDQLRLFHNIWYFCRRQESKAARF